MPYQRPFFSTMALIYCLCLGLFTLLQNPRSKLNRSFAFFNFSNAFWNLGEYTVLIPNHELGLFFLRLTGMGGSLMLPFFMEFIYRATDVSEERGFKRSLWTFRILSIGFVLLHFTPWILKGLSYQPLASMTLLEIPGPLYPLFGLFLIIGIGFTAFPIWQKLKTARDAQRTQILYCILACCFGALALFVFFLSFSFKDMPWLYYPLQALVSSIFAYAIFKHNLLPIGIAIRRMILFFGIYVLIGMVLIPTFYTYTRHTLKIDMASASSLIGLVLVGGILFSVGPFLYAAMIRRSALFQDTAASHITHEFKTPIHAIQSAKEVLHTELARPKPDAEKIKDYMDMIQRNADRLEKFVSEILSTVKAGERNPSLNKERIDLVELARDVIAQFPMLGARLQFIPSGDTRVRADREAMRQVMTNLVSNAVKFSRDGTITLTMEGTRVVVEDQGKGIAKEDLNRIFEPFFQCGEGKTARHGTGLGLAIAKRWVEAHNGKIWAESDGPGKGARFIFVLPY